MQAEHHQIGLRHQRLLGVGVLAQGRVYADEFHAGHGLQALANLQAGGAGFAINEYFFHSIAARAGSVKETIQFQNRAVRQSQVWCDAT